MDLVDIIFEDNHLLVANKPGGLLTQPSGTNQDSLEARCKQWIKEKYQKPGNVFLGAAYRLDKPVSGVVVFGKTSKALSRLAESTREKESEKIYLALVEGRMTEREGRLEHYLVHDEYQARIVPPEDPKAKLCLLSYRVRQTFQRETLVEITLETGRYHQIRAQFSTIGHPIKGDYKYGASFGNFTDAIALHHWQLTMPHPTQDTAMTFTAPLPQSNLWNPL